MHGSFTTNKVFYKNERAEERQTGQCSRSKTSRECVFPEDVAVAAAAAVTQTNRGKQLILQLEFCLRFSLTLVNLGAVTMISLTDCQSKTAAILSTFLDRLHL